MLHIIQCLLGSLQRARSALVLPKKKTIDELMKSRNMVRYSVIIYMYKCVLIISYTVSSVSLFRIILYSWLFLLFQLPVAINTMSLKIKGNMNLYYIIILLVLVFITTNIMLLFQLYILSSQQKI